MASWSELLEEFQKNRASSPESSSEWINGKLTEQLRKVSRLRGDTAIIFYASAFLQKTRPMVSITSEDMNGFMNALYGNKLRKLTLILHTPGGELNAVESIVEYLRSKFEYIEVIVPYLAMSGGALISLASDLLILGRQSQLGPIDPQIFVGNKTHSARAIQMAFKDARGDIEKNIKLAHLWAPILQNMGPALIVDAMRALSYSEELAKNWLDKNMFKNESKKKRGEIVEKIADYFNAGSTGDHGTVHVHGQRIGIEKLKELQIKVELLEDNQDLQNAILTAYHLMTITFENSPTMKLISNNSGKMWIKNEQQILVPQHPPASQQPS